MRNQSFNFDEALKQLQSGKNLLGTDGILTPLIKQLTEAALQAEIEHYLSTTSIDTRMAILEKRLNRHQVNLN